MAQLRTDVKAARSRRARAAPSGTGESRHGRTATNPHAEEPQSLTDEANSLLSEARMVLPGVQMLLGFQLVVPFNARFTDLSDGWQRMHFAALVMGAIAMVLVMAPAAYHRLAERGRMSRYFIELASRLIAAAMAVLAISVVLDVCVVAFLVIDNVVVATMIAALLGLFLAAVWFVWPFTRASAARRARREATTTG